VNVCSCLGRPLGFPLCPLLQRGIVRSSLSWNSSTEGLGCLAAGSHWDRSSQTQGSRRVLPGWPNGMESFRAGLGSLALGGYPVRSCGNSQAHRREKFERYPGWPASYQNACRSRLSPLCSCELCGSKEVIAKMARGTTSQLSTPPGRFQDEPKEFSLFRRGLYEV
jgi:hypothetical protein